MPYAVLIDLNDFVTNLRVGMTKNKQVSESAQRISKLLSKAIIKERHQPLDGEYNLGIGGISLYFAGMDTKGYSGNSFSVDTSWDEYITETAFPGKRIIRKK